MAANDNEFLEETRMEQSFLNETSPSGILYGEEHAKKTSGRSILIAVGIGIAAVAVVIAVMPSKTRRHRNIANMPAIDLAQTPQNDEIKDLMEGKKIVEPPVPAQVATVEIKPLPAKVAGDKVLENLVKKPKPVPAPVAKPVAKPTSVVVVDKLPKFVEKPSGIKGEVEIVGRTPDVKKPTAPTGIWYAQLIAGEDRPKTEAAWKEIYAKHGKIIGDRAHAIQQADVNGKTVYRLRVQGFLTNGDAAAFCAKLTAAGQSCYATK